MIKKRKDGRRAVVLGTPVDRASRSDLRHFIERALTGSYTQRIVTLNPEIAIAATRSPQYSNAVRTADYITVDGFGLLLALLFLGYGAGERVTGTDVLEELCELAVRRDERIAFLLRKDGLTTPALLRDALKERWPSLKASIGTVHPAERVDPALIHAINDAAPSMLIVNFGHPDQEAWITAHGDALRTIRIATGIGGAIDYFSGVVPMPPRIMRKFGFEWLWRVIHQPRRLRRTLCAIVIFPLAVMREQIRLLRIPQLRLRSKHL
ncbi:MAG: WecB/TagA/CpsF family glycosyltransferase [Candidatus Uhrbacteria bacterium]